MSAPESLMAMLSPREIPGYLAQLTEAVAALKDLLRTRHACEQLLQYMDRIAKSLSDLGYLYLQPERFTLELPFAVDPAEPRLPLFQEFACAEVDRDAALERLGQMLPASDIVSRAIAEIYAGRQPLVWQRALVSRRYCERLLSAPLVSGFEVTNIGPVRDGSGSCALDWAGITDAARRLAYHRLLYTAPERSRGVPLADGALRQLNTQLATPQPAELAHFELPDGSKPLATWSLCVGPFYYFTGADSETPPGIPLQEGEFALAASYAFHSLDASADGKNLGFLGVGNCEFLLVSPSVAERWDGQTQSSVQIIPVHPQEDPA
jgi:hypothetical protein